VNEGAIILGATEMVLQKITLEPRKNWFDDECQMVTAEKTQHID
jgi:hypothetical protein